MYGAMIKDSKYDRYGNDPSVMLAPNRDELDKLIMVLVEGHTSKDEREDNKEDVIEWFFSEDGRGERFSINYFEMTESKEGNLVYWGH